MTRDFYPFVEKGSEGEKNDETSGETCEVQHPARIAVYDDAAAAPRVVVVEPRDVRGYLEEITSTVNRLSHEQGGTIPFMVIREIVENFIHAYFQAPTITILDGGNTIRFSDQGPGIKEKSLALEYGTSSATEEMKQYIRGVGSGLPYVQQYMVDKGGSLEIEDNIAGGTVVTISTHPAEEARATAGATPAQEDPSQHAAQMPPMQPGWAQAPQWPWPQQSQVAQVPGYPQGWPQQPYAPYGQPSYQQPWPQQPQVPDPTPAQTPAPQVAPVAQGGTSFSPAVHLDDRGRQALSYLLEHEAAGPTDLVRAFGSSSATWSRALAALAAQGAVMKVGQKYRPTEFGMTLAPLL